MSNNKTLTKTVFDEPALGAPKTPYVGTFVVFDTQQVKGLRINIDKIRTYARNGDDSIQISYDGGQGTTLKYAKSEEADAAMERLDSYCL